MDRFMRRFHFAVGNRVCITDKRSMIQYVGVIKKLTPHHWFDAIISLDATQTKRLDQKQWEPCNKESMTFLYHHLYHNPYTSVSILP